MNASIASHGESFRTNLADSWFVLIVTFNPSPLWISLDIFVLGFSMRVGDVNILLWSKQVLLNRTFKMCTGYSAQTHDHVA